MQIAGVNQHGVQPSLLARVRLLSFDVNDEELKVVNVEGVETTPAWTVHDDHLLASHGYAILILILR